MRTGVFLLLLTGAQAQPAAAKSGASVEGQGCDYDASKVPTCRVAGTVTIAAASGVMDNDVDR
jgi:hypothetical protein